MKKGIQSSVRVALISASILALSACTGQGNNELSVLGSLLTSGGQALGVSNNAASYDAYGRGYKGYGSSVLLERVRYCTKKFIVCTKFATQGHFSYWNSVDGGKQRETYIATVSEPSKSNVKYLVFLAGGQQPPGNGVANMVTGQKAGYKKDCEWKTKSCTRSIDTRSMAYRLMYRKNQAGTSNSYAFNFPQANTFFAMAFDTQFNHTVGSSEKTKILNAYVNWLLSKAYKNKIKMIFFSGSSRGGCLVMRMAKKLINEKGYRNIPIVVQSIDGVCKKSQGELGTYGSQIDNPTSSKSDRKSWKTNLAGQYNYKNSLRIDHVTTGDEVVAIISGVHSFVDENSSGVTHELYHGSYKWYSQIWIDEAHTTLGREYYYTNRQMIDRSLNLLHVWAWPRMHCPSTQIWNGSSCTTCGSGYWDGQYCKCSGGRYWSGGSCYCQSGKTWNGSSCSCPSGTFWNGGYCVPSGTYY